MYHGLEVRRMALTVERRLALRSAEVRGALEGQRGRHDLAGVWLRKACGPVRQGRLALHRSCAAVSALLAAKTTP